MRLALVRHGATAWNAEGRIQGGIDMPLSDAGRADIGALSPPAGFETARCYASPLSRAIETATILGYRDPVLDPRLAEHDWGRWEGMTRAEILAADGHDIFSRVGLALDFTPPDGESTRAFTARVGDFLNSVAALDRDAIAVTHRGVMRSAYAIATGWDMREPWPPGMDFSAALILSLSPDAPPRLDGWNVALPHR